MRRVFEDDAYADRAFASAAGGLEQRDRALAQRIAYGTVQRARRTAHGAVVLGADTLVALDGRVIGKPATLADAARILRRLSGRVHEVWTSVFVCYPARGKAHSFQEVSHVHFRRLNNRAIANYLAKVDPLDKAGAYAAQGHGTEIIKRIDGSYTNVVGLPMEQSARVLRSFGIYASRISNRS